MRNRSWILLFLLLAMLLSALSGWLLRGETAAVAEVQQDGQCIARLPLNRDAELLVETEDGGWNRIVVQDGAVSVTEANCPDGVCVAREPTRGGAPVVCLPHRLVIAFPATDAADAAAG